jgi:hypothetical protein
MSACIPCKTCHMNATGTGFGCAAGSTNDLVVCKCNAGFFGSGTSCTRCKLCSSDATASRLCEYGSAQDTVQCSCNAGFYGSGLSCLQCVEGSYSLVGIFIIFRSYTALMFYMVRLYCFQLTHMLLVFVSRYPLNFHLRTEKGHEWVLSLPFVSRVLFICICVRGWWV